MPAYTHDALDADGKARSGVLEAENAKAACQQLRGREPVLLAVLPVAAAVRADGSTRRVRRAFSAAGLAIWTRQLAGLVSAGIPLERALPGLTVAMLAQSDAVRARGWVALGLVALASALRARALRGEAFRLRFDAAWPRLPVIGRLTHGYNAACFAATLAMLVNACVPILKALQAAAETPGKRAMRADAINPLAQVRKGAPLASALAAKTRFPGLVAMFSRLGEQTGQLPTMLDRAARQLSGEVQRRAMALATLLEPLMAVTMGGVVILIALAVMLPIIQLNTWVK